MGKKLVYGKAFHFTLGGLTSFLPSADPSTKECVFFTRVKWVISFMAALRVKKDIESANVKLE
jgi:hypothetical protein